MTTKEMLKYLDGLGPGRILQDHDLVTIAAVKRALEARLKAGRPRIHASDRDRFAFHNAKRRARKA